MDCCLWNFYTGLHLFAFGGVHGVGCGVPVGAGVAVGVGVGATVGVGGQNERMMQNVAGLIEGQERFDGFQVDFMIPEDLEKLRDDVAKKYGMIDFLVHSAAFVPPYGL